MLISANTTCDFELDLCGYTQPKTDVFDWTRSTGVTGTSGTGPLSDHTYGTSRGRTVLILQKINVSLVYTDFF